jgi:hypothetical protein
MILRRPTAPSAFEKHDDDVGGGFVEEHQREDPLGDWDEQPREPTFCGRTAGVPARGVRR